MIEQLSFQYKAGRMIAKRAHVGVVASGDLEILAEPSSHGMAEVTIRTQTNGFGDIWRVILDRFFLTHNIAVKMHINDFGATPGVVNLRLAQMAEVMDL